MSLAQSENVTDITSNLTIKTPVDLAIELNCTFTIPDVNNMKNCLLNRGQHKIDWTKPIMIVDFSYLTFSRFFAMRTWYNNAHTDVAKHLPRDYDWCKDLVFMEKYTATYLTKLLFFCKKKTVNIPRSNIIYVLDCRHNDNWRVQTSKGYKGTRAESHERNDFHNFDIFAYTRKTILSAEQATYGSMVFFHPNLEADDMVALLVKYLRSQCAIKYNFNSELFIMANDRDYLQICENKTHLYDITFSPINTLVLGTMITPQYFLIKKILMGDGSDNITPCYIAKEFLTKHNITATNRPHLKCTQDLITKMLNSATAKRELYEILNSCRSLLASIPEPEYDDNVTPVTSPTQSSESNSNTTANTMVNTTIINNDLPVNHIVLPTTSSSVYFKDNQFLYNARVIDFENIPQRLVTEGIKLYNTVF